MKHDEIVEIIQDHTSMEIGIRMILEALKTNSLPTLNTLPAFNDGYIEENVIACIELASGKRYVGEKEGS